jgi:hypothetical protein
MQLGRSGAGQRMCDLDLAAVLVIDNTIGYDG